MFGLSAFSQVPFSSTVSTGTAYTAAIVEAISSVLDSPAASQGSFFSITEAISSVLSVQDVQAAFKSSVTEPITVPAEIPYTGFFGTVVEAITFADTANGIRGFVDSIVEALTSADTALASQGTSNFIVEAISSVLSLQPSQANMGVSIAEPITLANSDIVGLFASILEPISVNDVPVAKAAFQSALVESISSVLDFSNSNFAFFRDITEGFTSTDNATAVAILNTSIAEAIAVANLDSTQANYHMGIVENFIIIDTIIGRGWFIINDNQTITWNAVANGQTTTWQNIGDNQTPNWVTIDNTQA